MAMALAMAMAMALAMALALVMVVGTDNRAFILPLCGGRNISQI